MVTESDLGPESCKYTKEHEWVRLEPEGLATLGISDYATGELGDVVFLALPSLGIQLKQFEKFGEIESVKAISDLFSPVSGEVVEVNAEVMDHPELVNTAPFGEGWMIKVKISDLTELSALMTSEEYQHYLKELEEKATHGE